ncbi:MAG: peptidoglycan DD-metalloendopeptidase family protein [Ilumatobacteraceae bacterium]
MRALLALVATLTVFAPSAITVSTAMAADDAAEQAAQEIADARDSANAAADALFEAESTLDQFEVEQQFIETDIAALEAQISELQRTVEAVAVNRFTRAGTSSIPLLTGFEAAGDQAQVDALIDVVNETSADDFDQFEELSSQLADRQADLGRAKAQQEVARDEFELRKQDALFEVERLKEVEADRLQDEAVRKALEAEQAERRRAAEATAAQVAQQQRETSAIVGGIDGDGGDVDSPDAGPSSSGSGGGLTGQVGAGGRPGASPGVLGGPGWTCPVQGFAPFGDTWGAPRSGGRRHQGVDMIGGTGLPLVAVVDGVATAKENSLGGRTISLVGVDGNRYYYAHLDGWATLGQVSAGTVIGYLGQTGNARFSVAHLHFEIHPGGGAAVNPYPTVSAFC